MQSMKATIILARPVGLFSLFLQVVEQIVLSRRDGAVPIVYFNDSCLFWSAEGYHGIRNAWEYYFYPVSTARIEDYVRASREKLETADIWEFQNRRAHPTLPRKVSEDRYGTIPMSDGAVATNLYTGVVVPYVYDLSPWKRRTLARVVHESITIKPYITSLVDAYYEKNMKGQAVVGVHIRGREHSDEREFYVKGGFLPVDFYKKEIDIFLKRHPSGRVYAASDALENISALQALYPGRVITYEATRLATDSGTRGLHTQPGSNKARLGEEVMIEMALLSRCNFLIHGPSGVSTASLLFNPRLKHVNVYVKYGRRFGKMRYYSKKHLADFKLACSSRFPAAYGRVKRIAKALRLFR